MERHHAPSAQMRAAEWGRAVAPLLLASVLYVAFLTTTQPIFSSDRRVIINPTPMFWGVALIRTPPGYRLWLFPLVIVSTAASAAIGGGGGDSLTDPVKFIAHASSRAFGMFMFVLILDALLPSGIDIRRPAHVVALAAAMAGSLVVRGLLLPVLTPPGLLAGASDAARFLRGFVPDWKGDPLGYSFGQVAGFLGLMTFTPPALALTAKVAGEGISRADTARVLGSVLGSGAVAWVVYSQRDASFLFLVIAELVGVSFLTGFLGAAVSVLAVAFVALGVQLTSLAQGVRTVLDTETLSVQFFLATTTVITLLVASALEQRRQLQTQLERAKLAAEETAAFKSRFLAVMSHEIRSPLASITLLAAALRRGTSGDDERAPTVRSLERVSGRVLDLLDGVLSYSRVEAVGVVIERSPTDPAALIEETVSTLAIQAAEHGVSLEVESGVEAPRLLELDRARVGQVLTNLVSNGIRHGRSRVGVGLQVAPGADSLTFRVSDDGAGMATEIQARIFDPYYRAVGKAKSGHVGLGLAICRELVEAMGGTIGVRSAPGATTLWFELPTTITGIEDAAPAEGRAYTDV